MSLGQYLTGAIFFVPTIGAALVGAWLIVRRRYRDEPPVARSLAYMVLATAGVVFSHVIPAALGILSRPSALVTALVLATAAALVPEASTREPLPRPEPPPSGRISIAIAIVTVLAATVYELARLRGLATQPLTDIDMLGFHLPGVARFMQSGTIWQVDQFLPGFATAQYPNNGDFLMLSAVLPWHDLAFVRVVPLPFYAFTALGAYAIATELRASRAAAATMAAAVIPIPAVSLLALDGLPDVVSLATFAAGVVFLIRHARSQRTGELVLAGLAFGLSLGTKWYGLTAIAALGVAWFVGRALLPRARRGLIRDTAVLIGMMLLGGGIWLVRNLVESGNPIYPKAVKLAGVQLFAGSRGDIIDRFGYTIANYLGKPHILSAYIYPGFRDRIGFTGAVFVIGLVIAAIAAVLALRSRGPGARRADAALPMLVLGLVLVVVAMAAIYALTPGSGYGPKNLPVEGFVNVRWLMPAVVLAAALAAWAVQALGPVGVLLELAALLGTLDSIRLGSGVATSTVIKVLAVLALAAAIGWYGRGVVRSRRTLPRLPVALAVSGVAILALVVAGRMLERNFDTHSYAPYDSTFAWIDGHVANHRRVGIAGIADTNGLSPVLPAFGPKLGNRVSYVGERVRHSLHVITNAAQFERQLIANRDDVLLIGLQDPGHADAWARAVGYRLVAQSPRLALYAAPGYTSSRYSAR